MGPIELANSRLETISQKRCGIYPAMIMEIKYIIGNRFVIVLEIKDQINRFSIFSLKANDCIMLSLVTCFVVMKKT